MPEDKIYFDKDNKKIPKGWIPLTKDLAKGRYSGDIKGMYYNPKGSSTGESAITYFGEPPIKNKQIIVGDKKDFDRINSQSPLIKESDGVYRNDLGQSFKFGKKQTQIITKKNENPEVKITPVKQEIVKQDLTPTGTVKLPTDSDISIKVEKRGGKFAVDYFDVDEKSNLVPKTEIFDTADEADSFVKIRKDEGKFYGPSMTRRGVDSDVAKKIASKSSYGQYRKLGTGKEK